MRLRGPIRAPGDLPGRRPLASPTCSPGSRCRAGTPAPEPAEKFRRCKREKSQLGRTPAPTQSAAPPPQPDPWRRRPWPPRTLPRAEGDGGGGYPAGSPGAIGGGRGRWRPAPGSWVRRWAPPIRRPASLPALAARAPAGAGAPLTPPRRAGARAGCARYIRLEAPLGPAGPSLSGGRRGRGVVSVAAKLSGASGSSCSSPPEPSLPPSLSSLGSFFRVNYVSH